jgi:hypothetical protein
LSTQEIIVGLTAAKERLDQARIKAGAAAQDVTEARSLVVAALQGSAAGPLIAMISQIGENLGKTASAIGQTRNRIDETIAQARALGN